VFLISTGVPDTQAFTQPVAALTTFKAFPYCKKLVALKKYSNVLASGFPKTLTYSSSLEIKVTSSIGPLSLTITVPPIEVDTAGTTLVRSFSVTRTPGETKKAILFSP